MHGIIRICVDEDDHFTLPADVHSDGVIGKSGELCYTAVFKSRSQACDLFKKLCEALERTDKE